MPGDDRDLQEYFQALRREEETLVPPISIFSPTARAHGRGRWSGKLTAAAFSLATFTVAGVWLLHASRIGQERSNQGRVQAGLSIAAWKPATDFLLDTPGRELLEDVPAVGEWPGTAMQPGPVDSRNPSRKQVLQ